MLVWNEFIISQHFAYGFDPTGIALKPNALLYRKVTLVRSSDQDLLAIEMSLWEGLHSLQFLEGFSASLASCGSAGGQEPNLTEVLKIINSAEPTKLYDTYFSGKEDYPRDQAINTGTKNGLNDELSYGCDMLPECIDADREYEENQTVDSISIFQS
ncbi:hypothetical protein DUI87_08416 [Hirundo rustica rustica]|uniref:Uncharacterized protein n=1 Tax=Hirundo rustica rustica TaxID=333673 RepID=A0A3M0KSC3_HIRRU|nr:hypothetical protein DUI87_08416 [Hirundo rustica rustica]